MTNYELAKAIRYGLFSDRETLREAMDYAFSVFRTLGPNELAATTALMVVLNTISNEMMTNIQSEKAR
jgi:hypothetical protein